MVGKSAKDLRQFTERFPFVCHGLSLSLGGISPLDEALLKHIKNFVAEHGMTLNTEHLSWCADDSHLYDLLPIMTALPLESTCYVHVAGHFVEPDGLLIDTHGTEVIDPVCSLLKSAYQHIGNVPTCLERDFNIPDLSALASEVGNLSRLQSSIPAAKRRAA